MVPVGPPLSVAGMMVVLTLTPSSVAVGASPSIIPSLNCKPRVGPRFGSLECSVTRRSRCLSRLSVLALP